MNNDNLKLVTDTPSDAAKVMRRNVYEALEEAYDETKKRYRIKLKGVFSDETIAAAVGCSVGLVEKVREEFFGPADQTEPVEEIKQMQSTLAHLEVEVKKLENLANGLLKQIVDHRNKIGVIKDDLREMCKSYGWGH